MVKSLPWTLVARLLALCTSPQLLTDNLGSRTLEAAAVIARARDLGRPGLTPQEELRPRAISVGWASHQKNSSSSYGVHAER